MLLWLYLPILCLVAASDSCLHSRKLSQTLISDINLDSCSRASNLLDVDYSGLVEAETTSRTLRTVLHLKNLAYHTVRVTGFPSLIDLPLLEKALHRLENIDTLLWEAWVAVPPSIIDLLKVKRPSVKFHYTPRFSHNDPYDLTLEPKADWDPYDTPWDTNYQLRELRSRQHKSSLRSGVPIPNLTKLVAEIEYNIDDNFEDLELIYDMISAAPAPMLKELDLHFRVRGGLLGHSPFAFDFVTYPLTRFPPLEVLRLTAYDFDERADGGYVWSYKNFVEDPRTEWNYEVDGPRPVPTRRPDDGRSNLDAWLEIADWTRLHTLHVKYPTIGMLNKLRGNVLPSLKHLSLAFGNGYSRLELEKGAISFIKETAQPLESLSLQVINSEPWKQLINISSKKTWRELREVTFGSESNTAFLDKDTVSTLLQATEKLKYLDLNFPRPMNGTWDVNKYRYLASHPSIEHLTLRFPSPDAIYYQEYYNDTLIRECRSIEDRAYSTTGQDELDPLININTTLSVFKELRAIHPSNALLSLDIHVGDWVKRSECNYVGPRMRVAFYRCFFGVDGEVCEGQQERSRCIY